MVDLSRWQCRCPHKHPALLFLSFLLLLFFLFLFFFFTFYGRFIPLAMQVSTQTPCSPFSFFSSSSFFPFFILFFHILWSMYPAGNAGVHTNTLLSFFFLFFFFFFSFFYSSHFMVDVSRWQCRCPHKHPAPC